MKKYIFLLFNLIYLIGFSTDVKNITRRLSDKQIENINSVEDFFYYANGNKLIQFKGDITILNLLLFLALSTITFSNFIAIYYTINDTIKILKNFEILEPILSGIIGMTDIGFYNKEKIINLQILKQRFGLINSDININFKPENQHFEYFLK